MCNASPETIGMRVKRGGEVRGSGRNPERSGGLLGQPCFKIVPWTVYAPTESHTKSITFTVGDKTPVKNWKEREPW